MQTFLPYPDFRRSAEVLDYKRLGKQRVECYQILNTLLGNSTGWQNHPAVKMWREYEMSLSAYGIIVCREWIKRKYRDNLLGKFEKIYDDELRKSQPNHSYYESRFIQNNLGIYSNYPIWFGNEQFHDSHKSNPLRKDYEFYSAYGWDVPDNLPYYWPV